MQTSLANAPAGIKNDQISLTASGGTVTLNNANATNKTITKSSIGLSATENKSSSDIRGEIVADDIQGTGKAFAAGSTTKLAGVATGATKVSMSTNALLINDVSQGNVKNSGISLGANGVLAGAGGGTVKANAIGAVQTSLANAPNSIKNASISISAAGALSGAGGGTVKANAIGAVQTSLANAPDAIKNDALSFSLTTSGLYKGRVTLSTNTSGSEFFTILANTPGGSPFDSSGNVASGEVITVGSKITIDKDNERILIED